MAEEVIYSGTLDKKARSKVYLGRRWVTRTMKLLSSKKIEYYDGDIRRGEISLRGPVNIVEKSIEEADGMNFAFEISNTIKNDSPLLVSAPSAAEKEKWIKLIKRIIARDTWGSAASFEKIVELTESLPFVRKKEDDFDYDVEARRVLEEYRRNYVYTLDESMLTNVLKVNTVLDQLERRGSADVIRPTKIQLPNQLLLSYVALHQLRRKRGEREFDSLEASGDYLRTQRIHHQNTLPNDEIDSIQTSLRSTDEADNDQTNRLKAVQEIDPESTPRSGKFVNKNGSRVDQKTLEKVMESCEVGDVESLQRICELYSTEEDGIQSVLGCSNAFGLSPVHVAAASGALSCLSLLLEKGSRFNNSNKRMNGPNPLHVAASWGQREALVMLLECGIYGGADSQDSSGRNPLHIAAMAGKANIVEMLLNCPECDPNSKSEDGISPLLFAVSSGSSQVVRLLLQHNAAIAQEDIFTNTDGTSFRVNAFHLAAETGNVGVLKTLLDFADPAMLGVVREDVGWTAAHYSAFSNSVACLKLCIASGLDAATGRLPSLSSPTASELQEPPAEPPAAQSTSPDSKDGNCLTEQDESSVSINLQDKVDSSSRPRVPPSPIAPGNAPLHVACYFGNTEVVASLLQIPELSLETHICRSIAVNKHAVEVGSNPVGDSLVFRDEAHAKHVRDLLTLRDSLGRSALHFCVMGDRTDLMECLLRLKVPGVDLNIEDIMGYTPFFLAIMYARTKSIYRFLNTNEGNLDERNPRCGLSAMEIASMYGVHQLIGGIIGKDMPALPEKHFSARVSLMDYGRASDDADKGAQRSKSISQSLMPRDVSEQENNALALGTRVEDHEAHSIRRPLEDSLRDSIPMYDETLRETFLHPHQKKPREEEQDREQEQEET